MYVYPHFIDGDRVVAQSFTTIQLGSRDSNYNMPVSKTYPICTLSLCLHSNGINMLYELLSSLLNLFFSQNLMITAYPRAKEWFLMVWEGITSRARLQLLSSSPRKYVLPSVGNSIWLLSRGETLDENVYWSSDFDVMNPYPWYSLRRYLSFLLLVGFWYFIGIWKRQLLANCCLKVWLNLEDSLS